jgi:hypothetical protein
MAIHPIFPCSETNTRTHTAGGAQFGGQASRGPVTVHQNMLEVELGKHGYFCPQTTDSRATRAGITIKRVMPAERYGCLPLQSLCAGSELRRPACPFIRLKHLVAFRTAHNFHFRGSLYFDIVDWDFRFASGSKFQSVGHGESGGVLGDIKDELGSCVFLCVWNGPGKRRTHISVAGALQGCLTTQ